MRTWGYWNDDRERRAAIDGVGMFFGALIGSNLARPANLPMYLHAFVLLGSAVVLVTLAAARRARGRMRAVAPGIMLLLIAMVFFAETQSQDPLWGGAWNLIGTTFLAFALWLGVSLYVEGSPVRSTVTVDVPSTSRDEIAQTAGDRDGENRSGPGQKLLVGGVVALVVLAWRVGRRRAWCLNGCVKL